MEKIYEEKNHNNNKKEKKQIKIDATTFLSFVVALFAIVSLITVGFNQISFAALTDIDMPIEDGFLVNEYDDSSDEYKVRGKNNLYVVYPYYALIEKKDNNGNAIPGDYDKFSVYCLERNIDFTNNGWYTKEDDYVVEDSGLLYLLANLYPNAKLYDAEGAEIDSDAAIWVTQTAIWLYMAESNIGQNSDVLADKDDIRNETAIVKVVDDSDETDIFPDSAKANASQGTVYNSVFAKVDGVSTNINTLIEQAKKLPGVATSLNVNQGNEIKITNVSTDNKYYFSELIKVQGVVSHKSIGEFKGFSISIDNAPDGTVITDKNGNPLTKEQMANISAGTELYVRVPINKLTESNKVAKFTVRGSFDTFTGYGYRAKSTGGPLGDGGTALGENEESQRITLVDKVNNTHVQEFKINIDYAPKVPDTGMNTAQSIYFIGLVVLLCGIGIVYANTKPATNKQ